MKNYFLIAFLIFTFGAKAQISTDGLMAYYPLNGDALDYSSNNYDGTLTGGIFVEDQEGNSNSALLLNGVDEFVDLSPLAVPFRENLNQVSIFFKVKFEKTEDEQTILSLGSYGENISTNVFEVEYENDQLQIETETGNAAVNHELQIDQADALFDGQWHEILILIDGDSLTYCKDNEAIYKGLYTPTESSSNNFFLGCYGGPIPQACCFFGGHIDELQFYNRLIKKEELPVSNTEVSINESIEYFPNPTRNSIHVKLGKSYPALEVRLINLKGEIILVDEFVGTNGFELELPLSSGLYFLQIYQQDSNEEMASFKIIKQ